MNKAFTKESPDADDEEPQLPALPAGGKNYITPAGYARIKNELPRGPVEIEVVSVHYPAPAPG
jgi:hypothetical protein